MSGKRSIFEEVEAGAEQRPAVRPGGIDKGRGGARGAIRVWLGVLFALVVAMIVVGGLTRLTDSGLSITEWRPVTGALPPMSAADWQAEFEKYKAIDQYALMHNWMELSDFKRIYWWEWGHRQLGRLVGLVWAAGLLWFWIRKRIPAGWTGRLILPGVLGGMQGAIGWWMVASGVTRGEGTVAVASYRLAVHLGLAFVILGFLFWYMLLLGREERVLMQARRGRDRALFALGTGAMHLIFLQILLGALVAGIDAGRTFTDWPLMAGQVFPPQAFEIEPLWRNFFENPGLVQFVHRCTGYLILLYMIGLLLRVRRNGNKITRGAFRLAGFVLFVQVFLGVVTVLYISPLPLAVLHQLFAVAVWCAVLRARFLAGYPAETSIRG